MLARLGPGALRHTLARRPGAVRRAAGGNLTWNLNSVRVKLTGAAAAVPVAVGPLRRRSPTRVARAGSIMSMQFEMRLQTVVGEFYSEVGYNFNFEKP